MLLISYIALWRKACESETVPRTSSALSSLPASLVQRFSVQFRFFHQRREIFVRVALRPQQDDRQVEPGDILLVRDAFVRGYESVELFLGKPEELTVPLAGPSSLGHRDDLVLFWKVNLKSLRQ